LFAWSHLGAAAGGARAQDPQYDRQDLPKIVTLFKKIRDRDIGTVPQKTKQQKDKRF
jgi:hypothetical protein